MTKQGTLLVVDDNKGILTSVEMLLTPYFARVLTLTGPAALVTTLKQERVDVVLLDMNFKSGINTGGEGLHWLEEIKRLDPLIGVVLFTAYADIELAVNGIKLGASDFVVKPWNNAKLVQTLTAVRDKRLGNKPLPTAVLADEEMFWGTSAVMQRLRIEVQRFSGTDANILITGENGTGKEMLAHEIHRLGSRALRPWVSVDMGSITESLFESELFGHVKGSFTDAHVDRAGRFEAADGGTLFLDEIGNLPFHQQAKLLTAIQQKQIVRVGSNEKVDVDIRLICATNCRLEQMVTEGTFREDLFYRINTLHLHLPALRERSEDILPLAHLFMKRYAAKYGRRLNGIAPEAAHLLTHHAWYGNIRELQHVIEKAVILSDDTLLTVDALQLSPQAVQPQQGTQEAAKKLQTLEESEKQLIEEAIALCKGNYSQVAAQLGVSRQTLYNKMKRYGF